MPWRSTRRSLVVLSTAALVVPLLQVGAAADPRPSLQSVQRRITALQVEAEHNAEAFNDARVQLEQLQEREQSARAAIEALSPQVERVQKSVTEYAAASYRAGGMSLTARALLAGAATGSAGKGAELLNGLGVANRFAGSRDEQLRRMLAERQTLLAAQAELDQQLAAERGVQLQMTELAATIEHKLAEAQRLYRGLRADERARLDAARRAQARASRGGERYYTGPATGRARDAIEFAYAQLGEPYEWGAAGPDSWDCSGLTMMSWDAGGVALPHSSKAQYESGRKVARSGLRPGDLVFFYDPVSHVGIYIGDGKMIDAPRPGESVRISSIDSMPYTGATRP